MPAKKQGSKTTTAKTSKAKEKHYELLFPNPQGVPAFWFDQYSLEETPTHLLIKVGSSLGDPVFAFALSKSELRNQSFNFGTYVGGLQPFVDDKRVSESRVKRISGQPTTAHPVYSIRFIRAGRVNEDGELVLYTFSTTSLLHQDKQIKPEDSLHIEAEAVAILHADVNPHYGLVLDLLAYTSEAIT